MRRNIYLGRYELWRLFLTGNDHLPVKKMSRDTSFRELRSGHRRSPFVSNERRVRIHRYWNEDYLVAIQHSSPQQAQAAANQPGMQDPRFYHETLRFESFSKPIHT